MPVYRARLRKMRTSLAGEVEYRLDADSSELFLNPWVGSSVRIRHTGNISCTACGKWINRSFNDGFCFQCLQTLPECDMCIVKPELCHYDRGTCRNPAWGRDNCMRPHKVYLARSSAVKVGITRENPVEIRWMDQGAVEGMVIAEVPDRKSSGQLETAIARHIEDKTDFRKMLRGELSTEALDEVFLRIGARLPETMRGMLLAERRIVRLCYPLRNPPEKIKVAGLDKTPEISGRLLGIKGQYLVFDEFVFNVRAHSGYEVEIEGGEAAEALEEKTQDDEESLSLFDLMR